MKMWNSFIWITALLASFSLRAEAITKLKQKSPSWRPQVVENHSNGVPASVLFYDIDSDGAKVPMKLMRYNSDNTLINETDLALVDGEEGELSGRYIQFHGPSVDYHTRGHIVRITFYNKGKRDGDVKEYHSNGILSRFVTYRNGRKAGAAERHYENGNTQQKSHYVDDLLSGDFEEFHPNGNRALLKHYRAGVLIGEAREWYEDGSLKMASHYIQGLLSDEGADAARIFYAPDGTIVEEQHFIGGSPHGSHKRYHPNGQLAEAVFYRYGKREGDVATYNDDGEQVAGGRYEGGQPIGHHWRHHTDGLSRLQRPLRR